MATTWWNTYTGLISVSPDNVHWTVLPDPQSMPVSQQDEDSANAGRNLAGLMIRDRVAVKEKVNISWRPMFASEWQSILALVKPQYIYVRYFSPYYGAVRTAYGYTGDKSSEMLFKARGNGDDILQNCKFNFIEA